MHEMVLADWRNDLGGNGLVAVLVFLSLWRDVVGFPDVDEFALVHFELHKLNRFEGLQGGKKSSIGVAFHDSETLVLRRIFGPIAMCKRPCELV